MTNSPSSLCDRFFIQLTRATIYSLYASILSLIALSPSASRLADVCNRRRKNRWPEENGSRLKGQRRCGEFDDKSTLLISTRGLFIFVLCIFVFGRCSPPFVKDLSSSSSRRSKGISWIARKFYFLFSSKFFSFFKISIAVTARFFFFHSFLLFNMWRTRKMALVFHRKRKKFWFSK